MSGGSGEGEKTPDPYRYFLGEVDSKNYEEFRGPTRLIEDIRHLVDGAAIFEAMESSILAARKSVFITSWAFDSAMPIVSSRVRKSGLKTWSDLLIDTARRGVPVHVLINDFDAFVYDGAHKGAWATYRALVEEADRAKLKPEMFQVACPMHVVVVPDLLVTKEIEKVLANIYNRALLFLNSKPVPERRKAYLAHPGWWEGIRLDDKAIAWLRDPTKIYPVHPAAHHEKILLLDERRAYVGGINHIANNVDDRRHRLLEWPWHDAAISVSGPIIEDVVRALYERWNENHVQARSFIEAANKRSKGFRLPLRPTRDIVGRYNPRKEPDPPVKIIGQVHRTVSRLLFQAPRMDVLEGYRKAIGEAKKFIYMENQYFRHEGVIDAIIARAKTVPDLNVILLLPLIAEELLKSKGDPVTLHGARLQYDALGKLLKELGPRVGLFSPMDPRDKNPKDRKKTIYVHSKLLIVDDEFASVGSANANPRSFELDTELNIGWYDPVSVKTLRLDLWREQLGKASDPGDWKAQEYVKKWAAIATRNESSDPAYRDGYVIPFQNGPEGQKVPMIPDQLAGVLRPPESDIA